MAFNVVFKEIFFKDLEEIFFPDIQGFKHGFFNEISLKSINVFKLDF